MLGRSFRGSIGAGRASCPASFCQRWFKPDFPVNLSVRKTVLSYCGVTGFRYTGTFSNSTASVAQLVEQRFCKPLVVGSSPSAGSSCQ